MTTNSTDTDMSGTLLTTEWGNPPQSQPAGVDNYQGYGATGQGIEKVYKYLYDPADNVPPLDESEGGLALLEQEWVGEVEFIQQVFQAQGAFGAGKLAGLENGQDVLFHREFAEDGGFLGEVANVFVVVS